MKRNLDYPFIVLSIDIGGTKLAGAVLLYSNEKVAPEIIFQDKVPAQAKVGANVLSKNIKNLACILKKNAEEFDSQIPVTAIGIGCSGRIDKKTGTVMAGTDNFPGFVGYDLCSNVSSAVDIPAFALNDVQAHTLGEARWGAGQNTKNFILLAVGTGIGGAAVVNGKLMLGTHGYAGELGHVQTCLASDVPCACGKIGHLEAVASGTGIELSFEKLKGTKLPGAEISKLASEGDKHAVAAIELAGRSLGQMIAVYQTVFDPEKIVLCGSVTRSGSLWKDAVILGIKEELLDELTENLNLCDAELGDEAALIGAAEYALDRLGENE